MKHVSSENSRTKLTGVQEGDVQPNATDIRLGKVFLIRPKVFVISEEEKIHRGVAEIAPDANGFFNLPIGAYEFVAENTITVGEGEAGFVITRSTLNRNGVFITSGLYDSGYSGIMAGVLHVTTGPAKIKQGTRIGQYLSFESETLHAYSGSYGFGTADDQKYDVAPVEDVTEQPVQEKRKPGRPKRNKVEDTNGN